MSVAGCAEVGHHLFPAGEVEIDALAGHVVVLHLSGPLRVVHRLDGLSYEGPERPGDAEVMPAGIGPARAFSAAPTEDVAVVLREGFFRRVAADAGPAGDRADVGVSFCRPDPHVERVLLSLADEAKSGGANGELYAESLAHALAARVLGGYSSVGRRARRRLAKVPGGKLRGRVLREVIDLVDDDPSRRLSMAEMAAPTGLSVRQFSRVFKEATGLAPHAYVIRRRVERARELLLSTDLPTGEIAVLSGFSHQQHLNRHFARAFGVSPGRLRRESDR